MYFLCSEYIKKITYEHVDALQHWLLEQEEKEN